MADSVRKLSSLQRDTLDQIKRGTQPSNNVYYSCLALQRRGLVRWVQVRGAMGRWELTDAAKSDLPS